MSLKLLTSTACSSVASDGEGLRCGNNDRSVFSQKKVFGRADGRRRMAHQASVLFAPPALSLGAREKVPTTVNKGSRAESVTS
jgi:hypothetical protein